MSAPLLYRFAIWGSLFSIKESVLFVATVFVRNGADDVVQTAQIGTQNESAVIDNNLLELLT